MFSSTATVCGRWKITTRSSVNCISNQTMTQISLKRVLKKSEVTRSTDKRKWQKVFDSRLWECLSIVISPTRDESGRWHWPRDVSRTRACVCEVVDTLNINSNVCQQCRPHNVENCVLTCWRFISEFEKLRSQKPENVFHWNFTDVFRIRDSLWLLRRIGLYASPIMFYLLHSFIFGMVCATCVTCYCVQWTQVWS